jgi:phosphate transport system permease protein
MNERLKQRIAFCLLAASTLVVVGPVLVAVYFVVRRGIGSIGWSFLTQMPSHHMREGGIFPALLGTIYLVAGTVVIAMPLGVISAIYLSEYARQGVLLRLVRVAIVNLAGVPSVVYGLFGLALFCVMLGFGTSIAAGCCTLALLVLPLVITASEEALLAVPQGLRQASLALGATKWQTIRRVVLPNALPGILTGAILAIGRAAGETAPILFTAATYWGPLPDSPFKPTMALPYHLYAVATQLPDPPERVTWGTAAVLLLLVLLINMVAIVIRARLRRKSRW